MRVLKHVQLTSLGSAVSLATAMAASPAITGARRAVIQGEAQILRWRDDGTAPTSSVGFTLAVGSTIDIERATGLGNVKLIEVTSGGKANITFYG